MSKTGPYVFILLHMRGMNSLKSWTSWILLSALLVSSISCLKADTPFHICLPENGQEGGQTCYTPSNHSMDWSSCIQECKFNHWELSTIADSDTYLNLILKLLLHRDVYWIAASRNFTEWRWMNGTSLSTQITQFFRDEKQGNCLSWDVRNCTRCLQASECSASYTCLCQSYRRGAANNRTTNNVTNTTVPFVAHHINFSSSASYLGSVHTFLTEKTTTMASEKTSPQSTASAATVSPNVKFCRSTINRDTCYYYYDVHLTQYEAGVFCHGLGMNVSQFDNDNTTAQFVREKLSNIHREIWLGAVKLSNGWNWINGPKFTDVWTKNIISTNQDNRNETCLILVSSIQSFSSMACEKKFSVLCQDSSGIQKTAINSSSRIVASTVTVSGTKTFETETLPMPTSLRLEFSILNANNESNITKTTSTILTTPNSYGPLPLTQPGLNFSFAATAVVKTTPKPFTIKNGGFNFWTPLTQSLHTLYSTKTPKTVSDREKKQFNETAVYTANFCVPSSRGEVCYYYFEVRRNLLEAVALCRGLGMEIFHFDNNNAVAQSVREHLVNKTEGVWLGAVKLMNGWGWIDGQKFTDFWTGNIFSTDSNPENISCLIFVPSMQFLGRMSCDKPYSVLCQDLTGAHTRRPLSPSNELVSVPVSTSRRVEISVSPAKTSSRTRSSVFNPNNVSDFTSTLSFNLTNAGSTTFMALTRLLSTSQTSPLPPSSSSSSSSSTQSSSSRKTTSSRESKPFAVNSTYSTMEKTSIQTSTELAVSATNSIFANKLSTTVPTNIILQSVSTMQMNTVNRSILLEPFTTTVVNGETTLTSITLTKPEIPKINSSGGHVQLSTQRTISHVKDIVSLPTSSLKTQLHGETTQYNTSLSLAYLSTKEGYNALSTEPDRRFRSQQTTHIIRRSTSMSNAVPTSKQLPANMTSLPSDTMEHTSKRPANMTSLTSDTMEHTSQRPANTTSLLSNTMEPTSKRPAHSFTSIVGGNTSYVQNISARTFSFPSGSIQNRTLPVSTPSYYDSATTIYKLVMGQSNIVLSSQQDASKVLIVGVSVGVGCLLLVILIAVLIRKRMGNRIKSKRQSDQPLNVCQSNGACADGYIAEFNAHAIENPLYGQSEL